MNHYAVTATDAGPGDGPYHLSEVYGEAIPLVRSLYRPLCETTDRQRLTTLNPQPIAEALLELLAVDVSRRCEGCWDAGIRLKHPALRSR